MAAFKPVAVLDGIGAGITHVFKLVQPAAIKPPPEDETSESERN